MQLQYQNKNNTEMHPMLQNQALAIDAFQRKWQMAGNEAQAFTQCARSKSEDFVRCEKSAIDPFEIACKQSTNVELANTLMLCKMNAEIM